MERIQPLSYESLQRAPQDFDECFELHGALKNQIIYQTTALGSVITRREHMALRRARVDYVTMLADGATELELPTFLRQVAGEQLRPEIIDHVTTLEELQEQRRRIDAVINDDYSEDLVALVYKKARDSMARIDSETSELSREAPDANQEVLYDGTIFTPGIATVMGIIDQISRQEPSPMTVERADSYLEMIEATETHLMKIGLLHDELSIHSMSELCRAEELMRKYRHGQDFSGTNADGTLDNKTITTTKQASQKPVLPMHDWAVNLESDQREALCNHLRSVNGLEDIEIEGLEMLPFNYTFDDVLDVLKKVPGIALEGIDWITFQPAMNGESDGDPDLWGGEGRRLAHHSHSSDTNTAEIVLWADRIKEKYDSVLGDEYFSTLGDAKKIAEHETRLYITQTLLHEVGHGFHHTLPVALLDHWDRMIEDEDKSVSSYVREAKRTQHAHHHLEDFADTFRLYFEDPHYLEAVAPQRFRAMRDLVAATTRDA